MKHIRQTIFLAQQQWQDTPTPAEITVHDQPYIILQKEIENKLCSSDWEININPIILKTLIMKKIIRPSSLFRPCWCYHQQVPAIISCWSFDQQRRKSFNHDVLSILASRDYSVASGRQAINEQ